MRSFKLALSVLMLTALHSILPATAIAGARGLNGAELVQARRAVALIRLIVEDDHLLQGLDEFVESSRLVVDNEFLQGRDGSESAYASWDRYHLPRSRMVLHSNAIPDLNRELNRARRRVHQRGPRRGLMIPYDTGSTEDPRILFRANQVWFASLLFHEWFHARQSMYFATFYSGANEYYAWSLQEDFIRTYIRRHTTGPGSRLPVGLASRLSENADECATQVEAYSRNLQGVNPLREAKAYYTDMRSRIFGGRP